MSRRWPFATLALALAACGGPDVGRTTGGPLEDRTPPSRRTGEPPRPRPAPPDQVSGAEPPSSGRPFADTPITAFANALTDAALAAAEGRALPPLAVPFRRPPTQASQIDWADRSGPRPERLSVLGFAFEVDLILKRGHPPEGAQGAERWGSLRATIALSRNGLRLVELRPRVMSPDLGGGRPPPGLEGLDEVTSSLLDDIRAADVSGWHLGEAERRILNNESVWARVEADRPADSRLEDVRSMLQGLPSRPLAYRLDDVAVLVRDADDRLFSLTLDLDPVGGSFALATDPLVRVRQLWPR